MTTSLKIFILSWYLKGHFGEKALELHNFCGESFSLKRRNFLLVIFIA